MSDTRRKLFVITGPSGAGLGEVVAAVLAQRGDVGEATPVTARKMKEGERDGVGYYFYDLEGWNALKESGDLLEAIEFAGNDYGTSRRQIEKQFAAGKHVVLSLACDRARQLKANMPEAVCVYLAPGDEAVLRARYEAIARSPFEVAVRMEQAQKELQASDFCDERIDSGDLDRAARELNALIDRYA